MQAVVQRGAVSRVQLADAWRKSRVVGWAVAIVSVGALTACASAPTRSHDVGVIASPVQVLVHNDGPVDVDVFAYRGDQRVRIGEVISHGTAVVTVPSAMARPGHVQLMLHQMGGADFVADEVAIRADDEHADLHVFAVLDESAITVAPGRLH